MQTFGLFFLAQFLPDDTRIFGLFFLAQFLNYGFLCWNMRAVAQARYAHIIASDVACAATTFMLIRLVAETGSVIAAAGYILGGVAGSVVSVWLTKKRFGQ